MPDILAITRMHSARRILYCVLFLLIGVALTKSYEWYWNKTCAQHFSLLHSSVVCYSNSQIVGKGGYTKLQDDLSGYIEAQKNAGTASEISVYFRDLQEGPVFEINDNVQFVPASLLKLPIAMFYMNIEDDHPGSINQTISEENVSSLPQTYEPPVTVESGKAYAIKDLLFNVLAYSDNASLQILLHHIGAMPNGARMLFQSFGDLGIINPTNPSDQTIDVHDMAALFRILYNASYLTPEDSETVLSWMTQSSFKDGLQAGVPPGITVAHKFGERNDMDTGTSTVREFHDCGIVYYPGNPYVLCVMTQGTDTPTLVGIIREISRKVYEEVDSRRL